MKKIICLLLAVVMLFAVTACAKNTPEAEPGENAKPSQNEEQNEGKDEGSEATPAEVSEDDFYVDEVDENSVEIYGCLAEVEVLTVPQTLRGKTVVGIADSGLANNVATKIILPDTVEYIGANAFTNCHNLKEIELGSGLKKIGYYAFNICDSLETVTFPEGMTEISAMCFGICKNLKEVYVPASVTEIPDGISIDALCPNIVIVTPAGSAAEASAQECGLPVQHP